VTHGVMSRVPQLCVTHRGVVFCGNRHIGSFAIVMLLFCVRRCSVSSRFVFMLLPRRFRGRSRRSVLVMLVG
jgi:hypothetical protein